MDSRKAVLCLAAAVVLLAAFMPQTAGAVDLIVEQNPTDPSHFSSVQTAINNANDIITLNVGTTVAYNVLVEPGTYPGPITLKPNISVRGRETARTILTGGGSGTVVTADNVTGTAINFQHFTIINASVGISVSNNSIVNITNNVFNVGTAGTAIQILNANSTEVVNNTFFQNGIAVSRDTDSVRIINNIFATNSTGISQSAVATENNISSNAFFSNITDGPKGTGFIPNTLITLLDPLFVDVANRDFHLKDLSPCIDNGASTILDALDQTRSDIGAYGGPDADVIPFPVANLTATADPTDPTTISISWSPNEDYQVAVFGGYRIWYGKSPGAHDGTSTLGDDSPITTIDTQFTLSGLSATAVTPGVPAQNPPLVQNEGLVISWSAVPGATGYKIYYSTSSFGASNLPGTFVTVDGGNTTSQTLTGLANGQTYYVAVSAVASAAYYISVTAFDFRGETRSDQVIPGQADESAFSTEVPVVFGEPKESGISEVKNEFPEALTAFPNLPNTRRGCFIATAAYGHYSAYQVQALRKFRDRYLLTSRAGSAFVRWYYTYGPHAAAWLDAHPSYKPVVRAALLPAVGFSLFMTETAPALRTGMLIIAFFIIAACVYASRRRPTGHGGLR